MRILVQGRSPRDGQAHGIPIWLPIAGPIRVKSPATESTTTATGSSMISTAMISSTHVISKTIEKTKFYDKIRDVKISPNQAKVISMLLGNKEKMITNSIYRAITGTSQVTASRQLTDLVKKGVLQPLEEYKGRSAAYELNL